MVVTDDQDRRGVLIELRLDRGARPATVRRGFLRLFTEVFGTSGPAAAGAGRPALHAVHAHPRRDHSGWCAAATRLTDAGSQRARGLIYHVWPDLIVRAHLDRSVSTIKADAAVRTFGCAGAGVVWAVLDSGIDATHPHFAAHDTLTAPAVAKLHRDFTTPTRRRAPSRPR